MEYHIYLRSVQGLLISFGGLWSYRATFYRSDEGHWYIAEIGNKFMDNDEPMDYFGRIMDEGGIEVMPVDDEDDGFFGVAQLPLWN